MHSHVMKQENFDLSHKNVNIKAYETNENKRKFETFFKK
jgi:hypothetical protein